MCDHNTSSTALPPSQLIAIRDMFKRFSTSDCSTSTQIKSSAQRGIKVKIRETFPGLDESMIDVLLPKKPPLVQYKAPGLTIFCTGGSENVPLFYQHRDWDDIVLPTLKFVHQYPDLPWTKVRNSIYEWWSILHPSLVPNAPRYILVDNSICIYIYIYL